MSPNQLSTIQLSTINPVPPITHIIYVIMSFLILKTIKFNITGTYGENYLSYDYEVACKSIRLYPETLRTISTAK